MWRSVFSVVCLAAAACQPPEVQPVDAGTVEDVRPPRMVATRPVSGADKVAVAAPVAIEFSEAMEPSSFGLEVTPSHAMGPASWGFGAAVVTFTPDQPLAAQTRYTIKVTGTDRAGNPLAGVGSFSFTTEPDPGVAPTIVSSTPSSGAQGVALDEVLTITFSKPMAISTVFVSASPSVDLGTAQWSNGNATVSFPSPVAPWVQATSYEISVVGKDEQGNDLAAPLSFAFETQVPTDVTAPTVVGSLPVNAATGVSTGASIFLRFDEPMAQAATEGSLTITPAIACSFSWNGDATRLRCTPGAPLSPTTNYQLSVGLGAKDVAGNVLAAPVNLNFTTSSGPDLTAPYVFLHGPLNGSTGIEQGTALFVSFSKAMDPDATEAALAVSAPLGVTGAFSWNPSWTILTFTPDALLPYGENVNWGVSTAAKDLSGNALLGGLAVTFRVVRTASVVLSSEPGLDGYVNGATAYSTGSSFFAGDASNGDTYRAFVSFVLPASALRITSATLGIYQSAVGGEPYTSLGDLLVDGVYYGSALTASAYSSPANTATPFVLSTSPSVGLKQVLVTSAVADDLAKSSTRGGRSQFRLRFESDLSDNSQSDYVMLVPGEGTVNAPTLSVTYEYP